MTPFSRKSILCHIDHNFISGQLQDNPDHGHRGSAYSLSQSQIRLCCEMSGYDGEGHGQR